MNDNNHSLAFSTPENAPTEISLGLKKKLEKKKVIKTTPKKKSGLSRRELPRLFWVLASAWFGPSDLLANETSQHFRPCALPFAHWFLLGLFLFRVSKVRMWVPFN
jgi:hypothetical protein